jgi:hypothetical protein
VEGPLEVECGSDWHEVRKDEEEEEEAAIEEEEEEEDVEENLAPSSPVLPGDFRRHFRRDGQ